MKKVIYVFSVLLAVLSIGTSYAKGQYSFNFDRVNLDSYVSGSADTWYYNAATQKCVKGSPGTVGTKTYTTEQKCKDANNLNTPLIWNQGGTVDPSLSPIFSSPTDSKPNTLLFPGSGLSNTGGLQITDNNKDKDFSVVPGGISLFPSTGGLGGVTGGVSSFNQNATSSTPNIFGVPQQDSISSGVGTVSGSAKPSLFTSILNDLGFLSKKDEPKTDPLKDDKPGTPAFDMFGGKTDSANSFDELTYKQPEKKGTIALLLEKLGIGRGADDVTFKEPEAKPSGANIPGDKSPILDTTRLDRDALFGPNVETMGDEDKTLEISANPAKVTLKEGKAMSKIDWKIKGYTTCSTEAVADTGWAKRAIDVKDGSQEVSFTKKGSYSFTITCKDDKGVETKKTATVTVAKEEESKDQGPASGLCTITAVSLIQKNKESKEQEITKTGNNFLIELDKELKIKTTIACEADNPIVKGSRLQAYFGSAINDGKTKTFDTDTKEFTQEFTFTPAELQAQKNIIERPGVLNVKLYDFATKEESSQTRPLGILFDEKTEQELKLCYKIGNEEKCLEGKNANFGHIKASKDKSIDFKWEAKGFDLCWLANPKDLRVELEGTRTMASRQSDFENFGITCKYTKIDRKEIHQTLMFQIESESKTDDKFNFSIKDNNKDISCKGPVEFSWDIGRNWTKCEKIEPAEKTYFESKPWNIESGKKGSITVNLKENKTDKTQDLVFGIKCYQGDQDTNGEEKRIQVNLSKCETPKERNTAQCTNEANGEQKACKFSVANSYTKTVALNSRNNPGEGTIKGRFNISGCNWPASDQPIYLKARIIIDGREILLPQTGQKIDLSLKRDWEVKFSDIYEEGRKNILGTLWDDKGNPQTYKGREISGAPVNFTIKVDQCIDKNCTQTCSHNEKGDVIQVTYIRKEALPKHKLTVKSNIETDFKLTKLENGQEGGSQSPNTWTPEWSLSNLAQGTYILYAQKPKDHNVSSSEWQDSKDHPGFVWKKIKLERDQTIEINFTKTGTSPTPPPSPKTNTNKEIFILGVNKKDVELEEFYQHTFSGKLPDGVKEVTCSLFRKQGEGDILKVDWEPLRNEPNFEEFKKTLPGAKLRYINPSDVGQWWSQVRCEDTNRNTYFSNTIEMNVKEKDAGIQKPLNQRPQEPVTINNVPVLAFHSVNRNEFEAKIKYLKESGYQSMFVSEFFDLCKNNRKLNQKTVVITSDDGYISDYEVFYPVLKEYGMKGVVNIVTSKLTNSADYVSGIQLKDMTGSGIIEAGSHTHNLHNDKLLSSKGETSAVYQNRLKDDFIKSKQILKNVTGKETSVFALPYGRYNKEIAAALKDAGFNKILGSARGLNDASFCTEGTVFKRVTMTDISAKSFKEMVDNNFQ